MKIFNTVLYRVRMWRKCDLKYYQNHQNNAYPLFYYINNLVMETCLKLKHKVFGLKYNDRFLTWNKYLLSQIYSIHVPTTWCLRTYNYHMRVLLQDISLRFKNIFPPFNLMPQAAVIQ